MTESKWITPSDRERSATASGLPDLKRALEPLVARQPRRLLDVGCGYGGLTRFIGETVGAEQLYGVDLDSRILEEAREKGVDTAKVDVETEPLPYPDASFDLVVSLGMLDYLRSFDPLLREMNRVLAPGGHLLISVPNLGSWHNRLALLFGYQPRDVEVSDEILAGTLPYYQGHDPAGHIHTPTLRAFVELASFHGFARRRITGGSWATRNTSGLVLALDKLISRRVTLARRFFYLGQKTREARQAAAVGWWQRRPS